MHETESGNTRLARLVELERRYDGPIPESALRALRFPSERAERISEARREMALFRRLLLDMRAAERRRRSSRDRRPAVASSDLVLYLAGWRERRRRIASLLLDRGGDR